MKTEVRNAAELAAWLALPGPAVIQDLDLTAASAEIAKRDLAGCAFLGCVMAPDLAKAAGEAHCLVLPPIAASDEAPFNPYSVSMYTPGELYEGYDPDDAGSYDKYFDRKVYLSYMSLGPPAELKPVAADVLLLRRMHDATIATALDGFVKASQGRIVAIMGGHDRARSDALYLAVALLALELTRKNYIIATGGGPGLMEAANLGAYAAGFADPEAVVRASVERLKAAPTYKDTNWLKVGYQVWKGLGKPADFAKSRNLGIPTWFYGHEPPNVFATDIAKYFENSVREEGLLAIAHSGVLFAEGNGGTVQEIFQDACQNYYRTYGQLKSPMVLLGTEYWNWTEPDYGNPADRRRSVYPVLKKLASEKGFADYVHITDSTLDAIDFIVNHPPVKA
jgi:hypothetical protein